MSQPTVNKKLHKKMKDIAKSEGKLLLQVYNEAIELFISDHQKRKEKKLYDEYNKINE